MDHDRFDDLTRAFATGVSRRQVLKLLGGSVAGGLFAALGIGEAAADDTCKPAGKKCNKSSQCCATSVAHATASCTHGTCGFTCTQGYKLCNGACIPATDCCGGCPAGQACQNGTCAITCDMTCIGGEVTATCECACPAGSTACSGTCVDTSSDVSNCGTCGNDCGAAFPNAYASCSEGACIFDYCQFGYGDCNHDLHDGCETSLLFDNNNCGDCGIVCPAGTICLGGDCG